MKYVAISDTHFGQLGIDGSGQYSILSSGSNKIEDLNQLIKSFSQNSPVSLICVGDILDLSLSYLRDSLSEFKNFLNSLPKFEKIIYVVGNRDHHLWTMHQEYKVSQNLLNGKLPEKGSLYKATSEFGENFKLLSTFLNMPVDIVYPMYNLPNTSIYFSHGHLFGDLYTLVSDALKPFSKNMVYPSYVSTVNVSIIEFIYWLLGQTGENMGADGIVEAIYSDTQKGKKSLLFKSLKNLIKVLLPNGIINGIPDSWERAIVKWAGKGIIKEYVKKPIVSLDRHSPSEQSRKRAELWVDNTINKKIKLITGHTHVSDYYVSDKIELYNLGGWIITPEDQIPDSKVALIDGENIVLKGV